MSRPVPAEFDVDGYTFRYERHIVYWRRLSNGDIGIVTILHERMHQMDRFREDFGLRVSPRDMSEPGSHAYPDAGRDPEATAA
jgi:hypothetical protein